MPRKMQTNSFEKGMNKSLTKDRIPPTSYRDALNFRLSDDDEKSAGALVNVKGNALEFDIPQSPSCWVLKPIPNTEEPPVGTTDDLVIDTVSGLITINLFLSSGGFSDLFNQILFVEYSHNPYCNSSNFSSKLTSSAQRRHSAAGNSRLVLAR